MEGDESAAKTLSSDRVVLALDKTAHAVTECRHGLRGVSFWLLQGICAHGTSSSSRSWRKSSAFQLSWTFSPQPQSHCLNF